MATFIADFKTGDRVIRPIVLDNGTWAQEGDACLDGSPLRLGIVVHINLEEGVGENRFHYRVAWDDGEVGTYLGHGISLQRKTA